MIRGTKILLLAGVAVSTLSLAGCNRRGKFSPVDMWNRSRYKPLEAETLANVTSSSRDLPPGVVFRGQIEQDKLYPPSDHGMTVKQMDAAGHVREMPTTLNNRGLTGDYRVRGGGAEVTKFPFPVTKEVLLRGQERFDIYCSPCHGKTGEGDGMIVRRGFSQPPTYHQERLRKAPVGHFFDVITNGYGAMYPYSNRLNPEDRWAVVAYIRALQLSRDAKMNDVPQAQRANIGKPKAPAVDTAHDEAGGH